jgi:NAD(P)-dependent dehydrogenase (short-subunit alcohol dehydrogenase family)
MSAGFDPTVWAHPKGTVIIVTGAGSGIGQATAIQAARLGLRVAAWDFKPGGTQRTIALAGEQHGLSISPIQADVTSKEAIQNAMAETEKIGRPTLLVNNAGPTAIGTQLAFSDAVTAAVGSVQMVTEAFLATDPPDGSSIVNIASVVGPIVAGGSSWYCAAKSAIVGYTRFLAVTLAPRIRANVVAPGGPVRTPRNQAFIDEGRFATHLARNPMKRPGRPDELAAAILFLLSPASSYVNGVLLPVDGGLTVAE